MVDPVLSAPPARKPAGSPTRGSRSAHPRDTSEQASELDTDLASLLLSAPPDPVLVLDADGCVRWASDGAEALLGCRPAALTERPLHELVDPSQRPEARAWAERCARSADRPAHPERIELRIPHADGTLRTIEFHGRGAAMPDRSPRVVATLRDATERAAATAALRASELRYRQFFEDDITGDYVSTPDGRLLACNAALVAILGYDSVDELLGVPAPALYTDPGERTAMVDRLKREKTLRRVEVELRRKDGRSVHVIATVIGAFDERGELVSFRGYLFDITAQRRLVDERSQLLSRERAARSLAEAAERRTAFLAEVGSTLDSSLDYRQTLARLARFVVPTLGDYCLIDEATPHEGSRRVAVAHIDCEAERLLLADDGTSPGADADRHPVLRVLRTGQAVRAPDVSADALDAIAHDPRHREALRRMGIRSYLIVPLRARGRILGALTLVSSVSGRRFAEQDVELAQAVADRAALAVDNARLYSGAQQAARAREEVLAFVSHDLRNPLATILLNSSALIETIPGERLRPEEREQLEWIARSSEQMNHMIQGLLDVAGIESGRLPIRALATRMSSVLREAAAVLRPLADEKRIRLEVMGLDRDLSALADREKLLRVLSNLVGNAIKFTGPGGTIRVSVERREELLAVSVADNGPGIPLDDQPYLFEPYWQGPAHRDGASHGSGLGLTIAKGIVEAHGGTIWFEATPRGGSTFVFTLPVAEAVV